jgi:predicted branched-subunit amino acid permease
VYEQYCRGEFGKRAMMRHIFGDETYAQLEGAADKKGEGEGREWMLVCGLALLFVAMLVGLVVGAYFLSRRTLAPEAATLHAPAAPKGGDAASATPVHDDF